MDRLTQLRGEAGGSRDTTLDNSLASEAYMTANENSSKYFSLSEEDSSFDISPIKDVSLASTAEPEKTTTGTDQLISNLSPIPKKNDLLDSYKFGKQIEAANILSGGVDIFDDNDNSYDGDELVIDDNVVEIDDKSNSDLKLTENSELPYQKAEEITESALVDNESAIASKDSEVVLQIDGKNVNAIDIGNGLYLYRKVGEEELAAVQIIDDDLQQPSFKFLKVRENSEGNLEVYEEIEIEVPKEVPVKDGKNLEKNASHVPIKDINKVISDNSSNKVAEKIIKSPQKEIAPATSSVESVTESNKDTLSDCKTELNLNGKMVIFNETRKSPVIHSTPNKEGIPLTKTMVDLQLHPNRHLDNVKTIELHTDKQKPIETSLKKDIIDDNKSPELVNCDKDVSNENSEETIENIQEEITKSEEKRFKSKDDSSDVAAVIPNEDIKRSDDEHLKLIMDLTEENYDKSRKAIVGDKKNTDSTSSQEGESNNIDNAKTCVGNTMEIILPDMSPINVTNQDKQDKNDEMNSTVTEIPSVKPIEEKVLPQDSEASVKGETIQTTEKVESKAGKLSENIKVKEQLSVNIGEITNSQHAPEGITDKHIAPKHKENPNIANSPEKEGEKKGKTEDRNIQNEGKDSVQGMPVIEKSLEDINIVVSDKVSKEMIQPKEKVGEKLMKSNTVCKESEIKINKDGPLRDNILEKSDKEETSESNKDDQDKKVSILKEKDKEYANKNVVDLVSKPKVIDPKNVITKRDNTSQQKVEATVRADKAVTKTTKVSEIYKDVTETTGVKKELSKYITTVEQNTNSSNHAQVPFGKWTEVNRQAFLNKIKETKIPINTSNTKQLKQPNDLNRRDVLQKIDSQRQSSNATAKLQEFRAATKLNVKNEPKSFTNKPMINKETKHPVKSETPLFSENPITNKPVAKPEPIKKPHTQKPNSATTVTNLPKKEGTQRKEINNQDLIDKTIEGIINRAVTTKSIPDDNKQNVPKEPTKTVKEYSSCPVVKQQLKDTSPVLFDAIEMKMNELHGIPFVERPPHELPKIFNSEQKPVAKTENTRENNKPDKVPNLLPFNKVQQKIAKDVVEIDSEEEIIEHEPITGDIELNKKKGSSNSAQIASTTNATQPKNESSKKEPIITENDFDKFARRNSITYENCLTVNFEGNEQPNVVQTVVEKDFPVKKYSRNEILLAEAKVKSTHKQQQQQYRNSHSNKIQIASKLVPVNEDALNKNYQSKLQVAYQTALTAKRHMESPITIIEDKPVKVVFMDSHTEFTPTQLNVQGKELSPLKKSELDAATLSTGDSMDSDVLDSVADTKTQDEAKIKIKHQRKQVLTPVETPELELIEPTDLGFQASPKKKRKTDDCKVEKSLKNLVPKKSYLLGRSATVRETPSDLATSPLKESVNQENSIVSHKDAASAIDNLVKAAELLETQYNNLNKSNNNVGSDSASQSTPVKRGRGRPRKYPLPDGAQEKNKESSPQKKSPQTQEKRVSKRTSDEEETSDDELIKENWTMGKINENIVCPICSKLFRSENVVFKHVKHCTGPSPNRSDSSKRSPRRSRLSRESESKSQGSRSDDMDLYSEEPSLKKYTPKKRKCNDVASESKPDEDELIVIEDSQKEKHNESKQHESRKTATKSKPQHGSMNLACEYCGKTFRQLSYLVSHKLQHKKEETKKTEHDTVTSKSVFSCESCKKEFRKLHHLVQHRLIHNPSNMSTRTSRKSSSEQSDNKTKDSDSFKQNEDQNAAFRCEPCDKSFRKLHHLVEHRETHDGINRQKITTIATTSAIEKPMPNPPPQCDFCKKTFRKLHHLVEHKEQHLDASSEKSDDKSVKSSLSTKDIIHECSLCYMVFPNEQALNKHFVNCQRKKRQSVAKQNKPAEDDEADEHDNVVEESTPKVEEVLPIINENQETDKDKELQANSVSPVVPVKLEEVARVVETRLSKEIETKCETKPSPNKRDLPDVQICEAVHSEDEIPAKIKKVERKSKECESAKIKNTPKKKISVKDKVQPVATRRQKSTSSDLPLKRVVERAATVECSDDDDIRYMINPDYKVLETTESKLFINVIAKKRNSLQIERPNSNELVKRRTSSQHAPKIPRLKPKPLDIKTLHATTATIKSFARNSKLEPVPSTDLDSDDSDVKYSFPKTFVDKSLSQEPKSKEKVKTPKDKRKSLIEKRKTLSGIAKRKSLGKPVATKHIEKPATPVKQIKRRTIEVEHRCDCGQLFSSAALLSRHTTLAHTPPRIRRRRSPPPEPHTSAKTALRKSSVSDKIKNTKTRKSSARSDASSSNTKPAAGKSTAGKSAKESEPVATSGSTIKTKKNVAHRGVPVPEKMKKLAEKMKKKVL